MPRSPKPSTTAIKQSNKPTRMVKRIPIRRLFSIAIVCPSQKSQATMPPIPFRQHGHLALMAPDGRKMEKAFMKYLLFG